MEKNLFFRIVLTPKKMILSQFWGTLINGKRRRVPPSTFQFFTNLKRFYQSKMGFHHTFEDGIVKGKRGCKN